MHSIQEKRQSAAQADNVENVHTFLPFQTDFTLNVKSSLSLSGEYKIFVGRNVKSK